MEKFFQHYLVTIFSHVRIVFDKILDNILNKIPDRIFDLHCWLPIKANRGLKTARERATSDFVPQEREPSSLRKEQTAIRLFEGGREVARAFIARAYQIAAMHGSASASWLRLDQLAGNVEIEARKFAINLAADCRNIREEQSFPGNFWLADQECSGQRTRSPIDFCHVRTTLSLVVDAEQPTRIQSATKSSGLGRTVIDGANEIRKIRVTAFH